ncbi:hypothetical protein RB593_004074 [Gaeumannomyces tritici]
MEAFAAIGLASNILQFLTLGANIVSDSREIFESARGITKELGGVEEMCQRLSRLCTNLSIDHPIPPAPYCGNSAKSKARTAEDGLAELAVQCKATAEELAEQIRSMILDPAQGPRTKRGALRAAIKAHLGKEKTEDLQKRLQGYREELVVHFLQITTAQDRLSLDSSVIQHLEDLKAANLGLVHDHSAKIAQLTTIIQDLPRQTNMLRQLYGTELLAQLSTISKDLEIICASSTRQRISEHEVVQALHFDARPMRQESIPEAHKKTFRWLFGSTADNQGDWEAWYRPSHKTVATESLLLRWLRKGSGVYWVSGKPGSGKSTFMKFVARHPKTQVALNAWSRSSECRTGAYYFWSAGTRLEKSVEGLFRSLLFDVLVHDPDLIPLLFPQRWATLTAARRGPRRRTLVDETWTMKELSDAFRLLSKAPESRRFCFFIDGLDEYSGDHLELLEVLDSMKASQNIKLCVSSRPWNVFEDKLGRESSTKLYLHELTRPDIAKYVKSTLNNDGNWAMESKNNTRYTVLVEEISDKAQGVFLWVVLVVRSIREGLSNGDSLRMLEGRLKTIPQELGPFFLHILNSIPIIYRVQMALFFRVALDTSAKLTLMHYSFLHDCYEEDRFAFRVLSEPLDKYDIFDRHCKMRRRLNARCKGLLEIHLDPAERRQYLAHRVTFLHRTVRDFLREEEMMAYLQDTLGDYPTNTAVLNAYIALIKVCPPDDFPDNLVPDALNFAREAEAECAEAAVECVNELVRAGHALGQEWARPQRFQRLAVRHCLTGYIEAMVVGGGGGAHHHHPPLSPLQASLLLDNCLEACASTDPDAADASPVLEVLLGNGTVRDQLARDEECWRTYAQNLAAAVVKTSDLDMTRRLRSPLVLVVPHVRGRIDARHSHRVVWDALFTNLVGLVLGGASVARAVTVARLQMLEELFAHGASPNCRRGGGHHDDDQQRQPPPARTQRRGGAREEDDTVWSWFCEHIRSTAAAGAHTVGGGSSGAGSSAVRAELMAHIVEVLLNAGADTAHSKSLTGEEASAMFPPRLATSIRDKLPSTKWQDKTSGWVSFLVSIVPVISWFVT